MPRGHWRRKKSLITLQSRIQHQQETLEKATTEIVLKIWICYANSGWVNFFYSAAVSAVPLLSPQFDNTFLSSVCN